MKTLKESPFVLGWLIVLTAGVIWACWPGRIEIKIVNGSKGHTVVESSGWGVTTEEN